MNLENGAGLAVVSLTLYHKYPNNNRYIASPFAVREKSHKLSSFGLLIQAIKAVRRIERSRAEPEPGVDKGFHELVLSENVTTILEHSHPNASSFALYLILIVLSSSGFVSLRSF